MIPIPDLARTICCEGGPCIRPESCDALRPDRVSICPRRSAEAVQRLLCERYRDYATPAGPISRRREITG